MSNAKRGMAILRQVFNEFSPSDPARVPAIVWALVMPNEGADYEQVMISFFTRSQFMSVVHLIQTVSGIDIVFHTTRQQAANFDGKVLDFNDQRGFFLRAPPRARPKLSIVSNKSDGPLKGRNN